MKAQGALVDRRTFAKALLAASATLATTSLRSVAMPATAAADESPFINPSSLRRPVEGPRRAP